MYQFDRAVLASFNEELSQLRAVIDALLDEELTYAQLRALIACKRSASAMNDYFALTLAKYTLLDEERSS